MSSGNDTASTSAVCVPPGSTALTRSGVLTYSIAIAFVIRAMAAFDMQ